jgi:septal ring factor EnvC (AmiA/AmiB activator)
METINGLLRALDNKVPPSIAKRLDGLKKLNEKLASARAEHNENPTEESQEKLDEIVDFLNDTQEDIIEDLSTLVEQKRNADSKLQAQAQAKKRAEAEARSRAEAISRAEARSRAEAQELEKKQLEEEALKSGGKTETKKSGIGWGSLLLGGALLVLTGGAIKYFGNKK